MAKLTKRAIDSFRHRGGWDVRWDGAIPGFGVRIYPSGKKAFVLSYRVQGQKRLGVLGRYGVDLTLDQARTKAAKFLTKIRDSIDPFAEQRSAAKGSTFGDLIDHYIEAYAKPRKKTWREDEKRLKRHIPARWRTRRAQDISHQNIAKLHGEIGATAPYEANRLVACLHRMFKLARSWGMVPEDTLNPVTGIEKFHERKRKRWARPEEVRALAWAIDQEPNIYVRAALWLYLLTGLRKSELLTARRADIDWARAQLRLPDTKAGEEQFAVLSGPAIAILRAVPALARNPYILPGAKKSAHLVNIDKPWRKIRKRATVYLWAHSPDQQVSGLVARLTAKLGQKPSHEQCLSAATELELPAGLVDLRLHDLRRTVGSWLSQDAIDLNTIKEALRHSEISTTLTYARLGADPAREAMEAYGQRLLEVTGRQRVIEGGADEG